MNMIFVQVAGVLG